MMSFTCLMYRYTIESLWSYIVLFLAVIETVPNWSTSSQILCAASVNPAVFMDDCSRAISVLKDSPDSSGKGPDTSISLVWIVTGVPNLTKVGVVSARSWVWSVMGHGFSMGNM